MIEVWATDLLELGVGGFRESFMKEEAFGWALKDK